MGGEGYRDRTEGGGWEESKGDCLYILGAPWFALCPSTCKTARSLKIVVALRLLLLRSQSRREAKFNGQTAVTQPARLNEKLCPETTSSFPVSVFCRNSHVPHTSRPGFHSVRRRISPSPPLLLSNLFFCIVSQRIHMFSRCCNFSSELSCFLVDPDPIACPPLSLQVFCRLHEG
jgi:hypothetical protein